MMLHADHEQNASTSTVRLAGSSGANPFACIAAGIACLWGPAHGGANQACLEMLREIGTVDRIPEYIRRAKDKDDPFRLMGFGHRVYKNFDPRAKVMKKSADEVLDLMGIHNNPTLQVAKELERIALEDDYFVSKKLYPNVDFYSGIILDAMGFPTSMFTPIFALSRTVGWISQWNEMIADPTQKIGRPRQLYIGGDRAPLHPGRGAAGRRVLTPCLRCETFAQQEKTVPVRGLDGGGVLDHQHLACRDRDPGEARRGCAPSRSPGRSSANPRVPPGRASAPSPGRR